MSEKLKTDEIPDASTGGGVSKTFNPGNITAKINFIEQKPFSYKDKKTGATVNVLNLILHLEGPNLGEEFEGFEIDKKRPELGKALGQVGNVKMHSFGFSDGATKGGIPISKNTEVLKTLKTLCKAIGQDEFLKKYNDKHDTIEDLISEFDKDAPFRDKWFNWCISGKAYTNKSGFTAYELMLPYATKDGVPYELENTEPSKVLKYSEKLHLTGESTPKKVESFGEKGTSETIDNGIISNNDFEL